MDYLKLTVDKLSVDAISELVVDDSCGAVSIFVGTTRDNFEGKKVIHLEYEAYETMALKAMKTICDNVRNKWPVVHSIAIYHRLGTVPCREASVVIAVSSPHRKDSLEAVSLCIDQLKSSVPIWKKEVYADSDAAWKENVECKEKVIPSPQSAIDTTYDKNLVLLNVSNEEIQQRIKNFIDRKREQVNLSNIQDFILNNGDSSIDDADTCARVRTQFVKRSDSKGHLKIRKVHNEWGPQTISAATIKQEFKPDATTGLPSSIAERVLSVEKYLKIEKVSPDIFKRLKEVEDKIAYLESLSPEYAQFWVKPSESRRDMNAECLDYAYSADDIARKIEMLERQS